MRIGTVAYASEQGLGHLARWFYDAGVITDVLLVRHPRHPHHPEWYPPDTPVVNPRDIGGPAVDDLLGRVQAMLFWETPFDWRFIDRCRERGVKTALVPMHEWFPEHPLALPDLFICPSRLDLDYFPDGKWQIHVPWRDALGGKILVPTNTRSTFLPIPVPPGVKWRQRERAFHFLHNAGHVGHREHKGTRQLLEALQHIRSPIQLTVRCQYPEILEQMAESHVGPHWLSATQWDNAERRADGSRVTRKAFVSAWGACLFIVSGYLPYEGLWDGFDVYVAPEKLNGLSLPLQEAHAAGLMVMTTDRYPANTWLPQAPLIPVSGYHRGVRIAGPYLPIDEAVVEPLAIAQTIDRWYGQDITKFSLAGKDWAEQHSWEVLKPKWLEALAT